MRPGRAVKWLVKQQEEEHCSIVKWLLPCGKPVKMKPDLVSQERITFCKIIMIEKVLCLIMDTGQWASTFTALDEILATQKVVCQVCHYC